MVKEEQGQIWGGVSARRSFHSKQPGTGEVVLGVVPASRGARARRSDEAQDGLATIIGHTVANGGGPYPRGSLLALRALATLSPLG